MAYSVDDIRLIEAWTVVGYAGDDVALDVDNTDCMTNGTPGEDCDEVPKTSELVLRIEIEGDPRTLTSLKVRIYLNSIMTAGQNAILPYIDANSVSATYENEQDYTSSPMWVEHVLTQDFIDELADLGDYCAVRLASSQENTKSKLGEVEVDAGFPTYELARITKDDAGAAEPSSEYKIYKILSTGPEVWKEEPVATGTSHATTGAISEYLREGNYRVVTVKDEAGGKEAISEIITLSA